MSSSASRVKGFVRLSPWFAVISPWFSQPKVGSARGNELRGGLRVGESGLLVFLLRLEGEAASERDVVCGGGASTWRQSECNCEERKRNAGRRLGASKSQNGG